MTRSLTALAALAFLTLGTMAQGHEVTTPGLHITHPWIALAPASAPTAAGYLRITNTGTTPERLLGVESDLAAMTMLHESRTDAAGIASMVHLPAVEIAPGETVAFAPGAKHIMFMGLSAPLTEASQHPGTLVFEHAGRVAVEFVVEAAQAGMASTAHEAAKP